MFFNRIVQSNTQALLWISLFLIGCAGRREVVQRQAQQLQPKSPIVAIVNTQAIRQENLWPSLIELGGGEVFQEYVLSIELETALQQRNFKVLPTDIQNEEQLLSTLVSGVPTVSWASGASVVNDAAMNEIMLQQGYGKIRKSRLLWRNAALRKLVQDQVTLNDAAAHRMYSIVHGPRYPTRIIVVSTLKEANNVISRINLGDNFSDVAIDVSIDSSASRGGHVNSISTSDPTWPAPIREAISTIEVNTTSNPIFIGDRWIVLTVSDAPTSSSTTFEDAELEMKNLAKLSQERFLMETLAKSLVDNSNVKIIDIDLLRSSRPDTNNSE